MASARLILACVFSLVAMATAVPAMSQEGKVKRDTGDKDKRSQEDIMFGNQQNKPAGMVDDLIVFPDRKSEPSSKPESAEKNATDTEATPETTAKPASSAVPDRFQKQNEEHDRALTSHRFDYYDYMDDNSNPDSRELGSSDSSDSTGDLGDYSLYDYSGGLFRKKRTLRNSLEELLSNRRLPRRAMRLKREANVDLLYLLAAIAKADPRLNYDMEDEPVQLPMSEMPPSLQDTQQEYLLNLSPEELASIVTKEDMIPPSYAEMPQPDDFQDAQEDVPEWFRMTRRSPPSSGFLYPQDYRYLMVPQHMKKRNQRPGHWGRIMRRRRQYLGEPSDEDLGRLYALASLLAEPAAQEAHGW